MKKFSNILLLFFFQMILVGSCQTEDIDPDSVTSEITIKNRYSYWNDYKQECTFSSQLYYKGLTPVRHQFVGLCWNFNTDTLPTLKSQIVKNEFENYIYISIPIPKNVSKVIARSFFIFNDTLVRYSDPVVINIPR